MDAFVIVNHLCKGMHLKYALVGEQIWSWNILKAKYRCWVYCNEHKMLKIMFFCVLSGQCLIVSGIFCQHSLSAFLRKRI
jgi:hypothetical protein